jgi:hypothetical protein
VFIHGPDGIDYLPRLINYDTNSFTATFQLLDALPNGVNVLHLSGPLGLTNLGGTPLAGNSPNGDFVLPFTVHGSPRGGTSGPLVLFDQEPHDTLANPQDLGILFPGMQQAGVPIVRDFSHAPPYSVADTADYYRFQVTQARLYNFTLSGTGLPTETVPVLSLTDGTPVPTSTVVLQGGTVVTAFLQPGTYVVHVGGWSPAQAQGARYQLYVSIGQQGDNPTPLTVGAAPALSIRLVNNGPPSGPTVVLPAGTGISPASFSGNSLSSLANLLPSSLLANGAMGSLPGGGVGNAPTAVPLLAQSFSFAFTQEILELIVLTQLGAGNSNDAASMTSSFWFESVVNPVRGSWRRALDFLFHLSDWIEVPVLLAPVPAPTPISGSQDPEMEDADTSEAAALPDPFSAPCGTEEAAWASTLAALALFHGREGRRRQRAMRPLGRPAEVAMSA